jgi:2-methylcitrate dehydratase PrpD
MDQVALKPFPACHAAQAVIQAAIVLVRETGVRASDIASITAIVPEWYVKLVCEPLDRKRQPDSAYAAQFSLPYAAACTLVHGRFGLAQIGDAALRDPRSLALAQKVGYEVGAHFTDPQTSSRCPAELVVKTTDGRALTRAVDKLVGTPDRPMTHDEIDAKFMANATCVMSGTRAAEVRDRVLALDRIATVRELAAVLRG